MYCQCCICPQLIASYYTFSCPACGNQQPFVALPLPNNRRVYTQTKSGDLQITAPDTEDLDVDFPPLITRSQVLSGQVSSAILSKPLYPSSSGKFVETATTFSQQEDDSSPLSSTLQENRKRSWNSNGVHFDIAYLDPVFSINSQDENEALNEQPQSDQRIVALQRELSGLRDTNQKSRSNTNQEQIRGLITANETKEARDLLLSKQSDMEIIEAIYDEDEVSMLLKQQKIDELESTGRELQMETAKRTKLQELSDLKWRRKVSELAANEAARRRQELDDRLKFQRGPISDSSRLQCKNTADKSMDTITIQTDTRSTQYLPNASVNSDGLCLDSQRCPGRMAIYSPVCPIYNRGRGGEGLCCCCKYMTNKSSANGALAIDLVDPQSFASNKLNQNNSKCRDLLMAQKKCKICCSGMIDKKEQGECKCKSAFMKSKESLNNSRNNKRIRKKNEESDHSLVAANLDAANSAVRFKSQGNKKPETCGVCRKMKKSFKKPYEKNTKKEYKKCDCCCVNSAEIRKTREEKKIEEEAARDKGVPIKKPRTSPGCSIQ